ncbi:MAG: NAD(P)-binding domain-containing protein [Chitinophagaceae bacterium]|nr:NAD(P)-binding domain-containing protein [Chitinophagaceae bacterium]
MNTKQTIAVIGASGNMGTAISVGIAKGNYKILLIDPAKDKLNNTLQEIHKYHPLADAEIVDCSVNAGWEADMVILAVPYQAEKAIADKIRAVVNQKIVISIANPLNDTYSGFETAPDTSAALELQKLLPNAKVVKAFNTTFAADFYTPVIDGKQVDSFIAGNDEEAVQTVQELITTVGFNPIIAGDLTVSRTLELMQLLLIQLGLKNNYNWHAGWKILHH